MRLIKKEFISEFSKKGVPKAVLYTTFPDNIMQLIAHIEIPRENNTTVVEKKKQIKAIEAFKTLSRPFFMLVSARNFDTVPAQLALSIAAHAIEEGKDFHWHSLDGSTNDKLRDDPATKSQILKSCKLLILSNVAANSTTMKYEKCRDLLTIYSDLPRILVVGGSDPVKFSKEILHVKPDIFVYF